MKEDATIWFKQRKQTWKLLHDSLEVLKFIHMYVTISYKTGTKHVYIIRMKMNITLRTFPPAISMLRASR